ncbi:unnamed protein product [Moneuplotes crassus]|uniref:Uncharacterized protein n=1 Tax=Euplotes crassus TaxID=5936 RepID=A0AAD1X9E5_EUPCR|nr:unnamed protein product [Moneuplotes crassus]
MLKAPATFISKDMKNTKMKQFGLKTVTSQVLMPHTRMHTFSNSRRKSKAKGALSLKKKAILSPKSLSPNKTINNRIKEVKQEIVQKELLKKFDELNQEGYFILNDFEYFKEYTRQSFIYKESIPKSRLLTTQDYLDITEDRLFLAKFRKTFTKQKPNIVNSINEDLKTSNPPHGGVSLTKGASEANSSKMGIYSPNLNASDMIPPLPPNIEKIYNSFKRAQPNSGILPSTRRKPRKILNQFKKTEAFNRLMSTTLRNKRKKHEKNQEMAIHVDRRPCVFVSKLNILGPVNELALNSPQNRTHVKSAIPLDFEGKGRSNGSDFQKLGSDDHHKASSSSSSSENCTKSDKNSLTSEITDSLRESNTLISSKRKTKFKPTKFVKVKKRKYELPNCLKIQAKIPSLKKAFVSKNREPMEPILSRPSRSRYPSIPKNHSRNLGYLGRTMASFNL